MTPTTSNKKTIRCLDEAIETLRRYSVDGNKDNVIYTAILGGYDRLLPPVSKVVDADLVCFTDNPELVSDDWKVICIDFEFVDPRRTGKLFKCLPHVLFPDHSLSIWVDGNFEVSNDFYHFIESNSIIGFSCYRHPDRNCLFAEAIECIKKGKDSAAIINRQTARYEREGMPKEFGLYAGYILARRHQNKAVSEFCNEWLREITSNSIRDQLSFPYLAWKNDFVVHLFPTDLRNTPGIQYHPHSKLMFYDQNGNRVVSLKTIFWSAYHHLRAFTSKSFRK